MNYSAYFSTFWELIKTDLTIFKRTIKDKYIDFFIWVVTIALVTSYLMPFFGTDKYFTSFMIAGLCSSAGLFETFPSAVNMVSDFENTNTTAFYLTLPIPSWLVFLKSMVFYTINSAVLSIFVVPLCKLILWNSFDLANFSFIKFLIIFILSSIFFGAFTLFAISIISSLERIGSVWMRVLYPLWFLGGFQFSWSDLNKISPLLSYLDLLNPMIYIMEGMRAAILGQKGYLPFWFSTPMIVIFILLFTYYALNKLKKRIDYI